MESNYANRMMTLPYEYLDLDNRISIQLAAKLDSCNANNRILIGGITEFSQSNEYHTVKVTLDVSSTPYTLSWQQEHGEGYGVYSGAYGMTLPKSFVVKQ